MLVTVRELDQGGVERDVTKIATHIDPSRFEIHVASYVAHGMRYEELRAAGVPLLHLGFAPMLSLTTARNAIRLRQYVRAHSIQVVHSWDASGILAVPVARAAGVPVVALSQLSYREILDSNTQFLLRRIDPWAHVIVVNCEAIRQYMIEHEHVPSDRVELCYNGVDTTQFFPAEVPRPESPRGGPLRVGVVCALRPEKGLHVLQEAFALVRSSEPEMELVIVGSGSELRSLTDNAARLGIADCSVFVPATCNVAEWLHAIDIFVLPSYSEAFSNALLEAMACGCAVVGSHVGGTPELIGSEERGLLFPPGNAVDLAAKLKVYMANPVLRRDYASRAARFAAQKLNIESAATRLAEIYESALERASRKNKTALDCRSQSGAC